MIFLRSAIGFAILAMGCSKPAAPSTPAAPATNVEVAATPTPTQEAPVTETQELWTLLFADGSGNQYSLSSPGTEAPGHLVYTPVRPENSSSGVYSGGDPADLELSAADNAELWAHLRALQEDEGLHVTARGMGTGQFSMSTPNGNARFIVRMGSELSAFTKRLENLRTPERIEP